MCSMRDPKRIPIILEKIRKLWEAYPDLRLGQLVYNAAWDSREKGVDVFYTEDDALEEGLDILSGNFHNDGA